MLTGSCCINSECYSICEDITVCNLRAMLHCRLHIMLVYENIAVCVAAVSLVQVQSAVSMSTNYFIFNCLLRMQLLCCVCSMHWVRPSQI
jgi:hypothetical protein